MNLRGLVIVAVACAALALVACSGSDDEGDGGVDASTPTTVAATATAGSGSETPGANSGIPPEVDAVVAAVLSNDPAEIRPRMRFETLACAITQGPSTQPPCREGEPEGTQVNVLELGTCEGEFRRADELDGLVAMTEATALYGVYAGPASQGPDGDYVAVFTRPTADGSGGAVAVTIDNGIIVYYKFGCTETPEQLVELLGLGDPVFTP
jgi:hypothetical protein